jgi:hypothetical protein
MAKYPSGGPEPQPRGPPHGSGHEAAHVVALGRSYGFVRFYLALRGATGTNKHHCTSAKYAGIARLAPLHVGKAGKK